MGNLKNYVDSLKDRKITVIGAGVSNSPLIKLLLDAGVCVSVRDKRTYNELGESAGKFEKSGAILILGDGYLDNIQEEIIFRTPGLMPSDPALNEALLQGKKLTSEMEVFFDLCPCKIIGITGSDGKTTTSSIIAELLRNQGKTVHLGGNIGTPLLSETDNIKPDDIVVVELSSFQLITMKTSPNIAVVTNLSPNHLDIHSDMDEYIEAKRNIFKYQKASDRAVFNYDNDITKDYAAAAAAGEVLFFSNTKSVENGTYLESGVIYSAKKGKVSKVIKADEILLPGAHNIENYLAAFSAVRDIVDVDIMQKTAREFKGVAHRIELVREHRDIKYYNDSIASSPSRTIAGLRAFNQKVILIAGGKDKGVAFDELGFEINDKVKSLVLTGMSAKMIESAVKNATNYKSGLEIIICDDFTEAVCLASKATSPGDVVLLSPACTSFDKFKNFEERGNLFKEIVNGF